MKRLAVFLSIFSLGACASTSASVDSGKALALVWQGLDAAAISADAAVQAGKLKGVQAATVATDLRKAKAALNTATSAYLVAGTTSNPAAQIAIATAATAEIVAIVQGLK